MNWMNRISDARCGTQHTAQGLYGLAHLIGHCRGLVSRKQRVPSERCNYAHDHWAGIEDRPAAVSRIHITVQHHGCDCTAIWLINVIAARERSRDAGSLDAWGRSEERRVGKSVDSGEGGRR